MTSAERQVERWLYAGRRLRSTGKLIYAWQTPNADDGDSVGLVYFSKLPGQSIGGVYEVDVSRVDGTTVHGSPRWQEQGPDGDVVRGWRAADAAASYDLEAAREEKRAAASEEIEEALNVLRAHFHACRSYTSKWSFAQWVAAEVARPVRRAS